MAFAVHEARENIGLHMGGPYEQEFRSLVEKAETALKELKKISSKTQTKKNKP